MNKLLLGIVVGVVAYVVYDNMSKVTTTTTTTDGQQPDKKRLPDTLDSCCYNVAVRGRLLNKRKLSVA